MKLLLLLFVAVTANAATLGRSKCSHGPSYWCGSIKQAKECGAVQYCTDNDWASIKTKDGQFCSDCEIGIGILQEQLEKTNTEDEIIKLVEKFCTDLGTLAQECRLIVDAYGPVVLKALIRELQPEQVCALMGFCKSEDSVGDPIEDHSVEVISQLVNRFSTKLIEIIGTQTFIGSDMCTDCTNFLSDVKKLLDNATVEGKITSEIKGLCQYLGTYKTECELIVTTLVPQAIGQLVEKFNVKQVCTEIQFCKSSSSDEPVPEPPSNDPCSDCKAFMGDVKTLLSNATVQKAILDDLETFCNNLGTLAPQCQEYVEQYGSLVFGLVLQYSDTSVVCNAIGFCKSNELMVPSEEICTVCQTYVQDFANFLKKPSAQKMVLQTVTSICNTLKLSDSCDKYVEEYGPLMISMLLQYLNPASVCKDLGFCPSEEHVPEALPEPGDICADCQTFVKDFDVLLNNYTFQEKLLQDVAVLCKYIPNYSADCKMYVKQYGALIFEVIAGLINPQTICTDIGLCQGEKRQRPTLPKLPVAILNTLAPNDVCADCKNLFQDLQSILSDPGVQKKAIAELELLCNDLGPLGPECKTLVDEYGQLIFTYLLQYIDPDSICSDIGLCSADAPQSPVNLNADMCADCKAFLGDVSTILNNPSVQQMILQEIETLCNQLGPSIAPDCQQYVSEYGPLVINFLLQYLDPASLCADIGFCSAVDSVRPLAFNAIKTILKMPTVSSDLCTDCKALVNDADGLLRNATVQKMFLNDLSVVCKYFGGLQSECKSLIMQYGPLVFDYIAAYIDKNQVTDPATICEDIGLCPAITLKADQCADCKNFFQDVSTVLNNPATQQQILTAIENFCDNLGTNLGPQCRQYVSEYGPLAINFLLQYLDPTAICGEIGFCPSVAVPPMTLAHANGDQCTDCKNFMQDVSNLLKNGTFQDMILTKIETLCGKLGPNIGPQCEQYVKDYGPLVFTFVLQYMDPTAICGGIGFCSAAHQPETLFKLNADQCADCKNFFQDVSTVLNNPATQQAIIQQIENLCNSLGPSLGPECQQYVSEYGPLVINFLLQYLDPNAICGDIGFCPASPREFVKLVEVNADQCTDCKNFFQDVSTILNTPSVQQQIIQGIENLCNDLGPSIGPQCQQYVSEYGPLVINFLLQYLDPDSICADIGFCSARNEMTPLLELYSALPISPIDQVTGEDAGAMCEVCKVVVTQVEVYLKQGATQKEITDALEKVCDVLPRALASQCSAFVDQYGPVIIQLLANQLDPQQVCSFIKMCVAEFEQSPTCVICEYVMEEVDKLITDESTEEEIQAALDSVCSYLPSSLSADCQSFVDQYTDAIIKLLVEHLSPKLVCQTLKLCTEKSQTDVPLTNLPTCYLCKYVVKEVESLLVSETSISAIEAALDKVCSLIPGKMSTQCQTFVDNYTPMLIKLLTSQVAPRAICMALHLCLFEEAPVEEWKTELDKIAVELNIEVGDQCTDCTQFFQDVSNILKNNTFQDAIIQELENLCNDLGPSLGPQCQQYVDQYGKLAINLLLQYLDPKTICGDIGFCSVTEEPVKICKLNADQCADCKNFFQDVSTVLNNPATQQAIIQGIENFCNSLGPSLGPQCQQYVSQYGPLVINFLLQYLDPTAICGDIGFCPSSLRYIEPVVKFNADQCTDCKNFFQDVSTMLNTPSVQQQIIQGIENLCNDLGPSLGPQCQEYVSQYGPLVINFLLQYLDPASICSDIGFCKAVTEIAPPAEIFTSLPVSLVDEVTGDEDGAMCEVCKVVVSQVEIYLKQGATQKEIIDALEKVCTVLPRALASQCSAFVDQYGPVIIQLLVNQLDPQQVCSFINICVAELEQSQECALCEYIMQQLDTLITKQSTEEEIQDALDKVCSLLPSTISAECQKFVDQYTVTIINLLVSELSPQLVCQALRLCDSDNGQESDVQLTAGPACIICEYVLKTLDSLLVKESTISDIEAALDKVCSLLPTSVSGQCQQFIDTYTPTIVNLVVQAVSPDLICRTLNLCAMQDAPVPEPEAGEFCAICEFVMSELDKILVEQNTEAQIENALDMVCGLLPATLSSTCQSFVDQYTKEIIFLITQSISPKQVCTALTLCTSASVESEEAQIEHVPDVIDESKFEASTECVVCEYAMSELEKQLGKNATEQEIRLALDEVCSLLPDTLREDCTLLVNYYTTEVIYQFIRKYPANKICTLLKVCAAVDGELKAVSHPVSIKQEASCAICEFAVKELEQMLQKDSTEASIRKALDSLCSRLPSTVTKECQMFVDYYTEEIIFILVSQFPPSKLCTSLNLCTAVNIGSLVSQIVEENTEVCAICEFIAKYLEEDLQKNSTEAEITKALDLVCSKLPSTLTKQCQMFVDYYTEEIIFILVSQLPPSKLCSSLQLCAAVEEIPPEVEEDSSVSCEVCIIAVRSAELYITKNSTEQEIDKALEYLCQAFPGSLQQQCDTFIEQFGNAIPELIVTFGDPDKICKLINLCPTEVDVKQLMFENCNRGPEFWCASQTNADLCNAVEHCKRHVWN